MTNIVETWHEGKFSNAPYCGLSIDAPNVMLSALKRSEDGKGLVVIVYEITGKETEFTVQGDVIPVTLKDKITPWSVQTYYLEDGAAEWKEVLLTEFEK